MVSSSKISIFRLIHLQNIGIQFAFQFVTFLRKFVWTIYNSVIKDCAKYTVLAVSKSTASIVLAPKFWQFEIKESSIN